MIVTGARRGPHRARRECAWSHSSSIVRRRLQSQGDLIDRRDDMLLGRHHVDSKFLLCGIVACGFASCSPLPAGLQQDGAANHTNLHTNSCESTHTADTTLYFHTQKHRTIAETIFFRIQTCRQPSGVSGQGFLGFPRVSWGFLGFPGASGRDV